MITRLRSKLIQVRRQVIQMENIPLFSSDSSNIIVNGEKRKRQLEIGSGDLGSATKRVSFTENFTQSLGSKFPNFTTTGTRRFSKDMFLFNSINLEHVIEWTQANCKKHGDSVPQFKTILDSLNNIMSYHNLDQSILKEKDGEENLQMEHKLDFDIDFEPLIIEDEKKPEEFVTPVKEFINDNSAVLFANSSPTALQKRAMSTMPPLMNSSPPNVEIVKVRSPYFEKATQANGTKHVIQLSKEQQEVASLVLQGHNIFYTGSAGTGKSFLLKHIVKILQQKFGSGIAVTASTGLAAYNIGGMTINSYLGIGIGKGKPDEIFRRIKNNKKIKERWMGLNVLIIDEVSMINGHLLDKLDWIARKLLKQDKPFGGIQIVLCGDFYQLPPVDRKKDKFQTEEVIYAFESIFWKQHVKLQIILQKVFRQQTDKVFLDMLQEVRDGEVSESTIKKFQSLARPLNIDDGVLPTRLFPTRKETENVNRQMLQNLPGENFKFTSIDSGSMIHSEQGRKMLDNFLAPPEIELKLGAQVMLIKNMDEKLVNGTLGIVVGFMDNQTFSQVKGLNNDYFGGPSDENITYYDYNSDSEEPPNKPFGSANRLWKKVASPLDSSIFDCLAKIKRSIVEQIEDPKTTDKKVITVPEEFTFDTSDAPYAPSDGDISKIVETENTHSLSVEQKKEILQDIERKEELMRLLNENSSSVKYPLVAFKISDKERRMVLVHNEEFVIEDEKRVPVISRKQVPIMLSWALSIHKAQGQTLQKVTVDLQRVFETGQAYVALSRAVHRRGLQVVNFKKEKIRTNPKVKEFYKGLHTTTDAVAMINSGELRPDNHNSKNSVGQMTQLENLAEYTASPERFIRYEERKPKVAPVEEKNSIAALLQNHTRRTTPAKTGVTFLEFSDSEM